MRTHNLARVATAGILLVSIVTLAAAVEPAPSRPAGPSGKTVILKLKGGAAVEGVVRKSRKKREVHLDTVFGRRIVPTLLIAERTSSEKLQAEYEKRRNMFDARHLDARFQLAKWCLQNGLTSGFAREADLVLKRSPGHRGIRDLLEREAPAYQMVKNRQPPGKPRWARAQVDLLYKAAHRCGHAKAAMIQAQLESLDPGLQLQPAVHHIKHGSSKQRWIAAGMLSHSKSVRRVKPLYLRSLSDPKWYVRHAAIDALKVSGDGNIIGPWVAALERSPNAAVRYFAAEALEQAGDKRAVPALLGALARESGSRPVRNHIMATRQEAYIKDFDVEIAQAAVIADPVVDTVTEGVVLDVAVVSATAMRSRYGRTLNTLTGAGLGPRVKAWKEWWKKNRKQYQH